MRIKTTQFAIAILFVSVTYGQTPAEENQEQVFQFAHIEGAPNLQEAATVIRMIGAFRYASLDTVQRSLTLRGTAGQIALGEWLVHELDQPDQSTAIHEYRSLRNDDEVRVFRLAHVQAAPDFQEVVTLLRTIGDMTRLFGYKAQRAIVLRGTREQIALAAWLLEELDQSENRQDIDQTPHEYRLSSGPENVVRVIFLKGGGTTRDIPATVTQLRAATGIHYLFAHNASRALALRGTAEQIALAQRLIQEWDR